MTDMMSLEAGRPETEVTEKGRRRRFTAEYKQRILRDVAACKDRGEVGALLRREGLYSSHLTYWRKEAGRGELAALRPKKRGPQPKVVDARDRQLAEQERETKRWRRRAERAEALVEVQKKVSQLLGIALPTMEDEQS
jgi:transposase-like protein